MAEHKIAILNRIAVADAGIELVCNNPTDTIRFEFDDEWSGITAKTARFSWEGNKIDVPFSENVVEVPEIFRTNHVFVGVYTDNITSTPAKVKCRYSIKCLGGKNPPPSEDVYNRIIKLINDLQANGVTDEQIAEAVEKYLTDNPIDVGDVLPTVTEEDNGKLLAVQAGKWEAQAPANAVESDNTRPITSAAVYATVGNINALLETI